MKKVNPYATIRCYDYTSKEEFEKHKKIMQSKGYILIEGILSGSLDPKEINDSNYPYSYNASYIKSSMI